MAIAKVAISPHPPVILDLEIREILLEEQISLGGEFIQEDPVGGLPDGLYFLGQFARSKPSLGFEPQNFESFAGD